ELDVAGRGEGRGPVAGSEDPAVARGEEEVRRVDLAGAGRCVLEVPCGGRANAGEDLLRGDGHRDPRRRGAEGRERERYDRERGSRCPDQRSKTEGAARNKRLVLKRGVRPVTAHRAPPPLHRRPDLSRSAGGPEARTQSERGRGSEGAATGSAARRSTSRALEPRAEPAMRSCRPTAP